VTTSCVVPNPCVIRLPLRVDGWRGGGISKVQPSRGTGEVGARYEGRGGVLEGECRRVDRAPSHRSPVVFSTFGVGRR